MPYCEKPAELPSTNPRLTWVFTLFLWWSLHCSYHPTYFQLFLLYLLLVLWLLTKKYLYSNWGWNSERWLYSANDDDAAHCWLADDDEDDNDDVDAVCSRNKIYGKLFKEQPKKEQKYNKKKKEMLQRSENGKWMLFNKREKINSWDEEKSDSEDDDNIQFRKE